MLFRSRDGQREHTGDVDVKVAREVEVDEARRLGQELGECDRALGREVRVVQENTLQVRVDRDRCSERGDLGRA